jgi:uncharacterized membrane protein
MKADTVNPPEDMSIHRIEALTDGVFAIVMTIMVLEFTPLILKQFEPHLLEGLVARGIFPRFVVYFISFALLGIYWLSHRAQYHYISRSDHTLHWLNIIFLAFVALVPFSAALYGLYETNTDAIIIFGGHLTIIGLILYLQWRYATKNFRLVKKDVSYFVVRFRTYRCLFAPLSYIVAIALGFVNWRFSLAIFSITPLLYILPWFQRFWMRIAGR